MPQCLVVIPTYNEMENVEKMLRNVMALSIPFDVLVVDDASGDGTAEIVKTVAQSFPGRISLVERTGERGLGTAYVHGFRWGLEKDYQYLFEMDCDFSHAPDDLPRLLVACRDEKYDLAIGSRYVGDGRVNDWPLRRILLSRFANWYVRIVTGMKVCDATSGFVCYQQSVLQKVLQESPKMVGYGFQVEMKFKASRYGFKMIEIPIVFTDRVAGTSKMGGRNIAEAVLGTLGMKLQSWTRSWK